MSDKTQGAFSVLGVFDNAQLLMKAIPEVKGKVSAPLEAYTPYPIHGMEKALGLRKSPIGGMVFVMGFLGALSALAFELWASGHDYPLITAGKPYYSWEAFVPIMFELTVLFAAFTAGLGMLFLLNRLPMFRHPLLQSPSMSLLTRDKFGLSVELGTNDSNAQTVAALLKEAGATKVEILQGPGPLGVASPKFFLYVFVFILLACGAAGYLTYWGIKLFPVSIPMVHMLNQPRLDPQRADAFFRDGFGMRMPVPGTVMRGSLPYTLARQDAAANLGNPLPRTSSVLNQGRRAFSNHCAVCHGLLGNGATTLTAAYGAKPANLVSSGSMALSDGKIYHVVMMGKNAMPSYAGDLTENERWAVVHYVRVLQRALNAKDEDFGN